MDSRQSQALPSAFSQILGRTNLGGMSGLLALLQQSGLDRQVASWLGSGANMPLDQRQLHRALGDDNLQQMSGAAGIPIDQLLKVLVQRLPSAVDSMSPNGVLQEDRLGEEQVDEEQSGSLADQAGIRDIR
jgi:uncharacterized protein YidB (DUF937 family)